MSITDSQVTNKSFLSPLGFKFVIKKTPNVNYFVQSVSLPSITLNRVDVPNPFIKIPLPGDHLDFGELTLTFKVDEDLKNYLEIYNWMIGMGFPDDFDQYKDVDVIRGGKNTGNVDRMSGGGIYSDATLSILSSAMNVNHNVTFIDAFPTALQELQFLTTDTDVNYLTATVSFTYRKFTIVTL